MAKLTLKVGDTVVVHCQEPGVPDFAQVKIVSITDAPGKAVGVQFADKVSNHDCDGAGKAGFCRWVLPEHILLTKEAEELKKLELLAKSNAAPPAKTNLTLEVDGTNKTVK